MTAIKKTKEFIVSEPTDIKERTIYYFKKSGFKHIANISTDKKIRFERGSIASNMWTFNPLNWKSVIEVEIDVRKVKATFDINSAGQISTNKDETLWESFTNNFEKYLRDSNFDFESENLKTLKATISTNFKYVGWAVLGGLIGGIPAGLIAYFTGIEIIVIIGTTGGAIAFMTKKINDDKLKNAL